MFEVDNRTRTQFLHIDAGIMATGNTLVHRSTGSGASSNPSKSDRDDKEDQEAINNGYEDDGGDSKSARLTLMEEILLLGLKDREVRVAQGE